MNIVVERNQPRKVRLTAIIYRELLSDGAPIYCALCPEVDVASQGDTVEEARAMLQEAVELFFECADDDEIERRFHEEIYVTQFEVALSEPQAAAIG
jgi:predicted RNase H-like HicB family nuclease